MPTATTWVYPKPQNWDEFEHIVWDLFRRSWQDPEAQRYGRSGQEQHGIDVFGRPKDLGGAYVGVQCKRYEDEKFNEKVIGEEIRKLEAGIQNGILPFNPAQFIIATTASRDVKLQDAIIRINQEREANGKFRVSLRFWEDLSDMLASPGYEELLQKHYPTLCRRDEIAELQSALKLSIAATRLKQSQSLIFSLTKNFQAPYRYLDYFDLEHRNVFFGRDQAVQDLLDKIEEGQLTILHAPSGAGKTSLLRAGLQAALIENGDLPIYLPRPHLLLQGIGQHILPNPPNPEWFSQVPLSALLNWTCKHLNELQIRMVIIIDQFEEFFIQTPPNEQQEFILKLGDCLINPGLEKVRFILALRKDYLAEMEMFKPSIPLVFENTFHLPYLTRDEARQAIEEPLKHISIHWADGAVDELLDYLEEGVIETPQLQLICSRLYGQVIKDVGSEIRLSGLDLKAVHAQYLDEEMAALKPSEFSPSQKDLAWKLLKHLVTSNGTKQPRRLVELYEWAPQEDIDPVLNHLVDRRLLRRDDDLFNGQPMIEVSHDTLANKIQAYELPDEIRRKAARELITRGLEDWLSQPRQPLLDLGRLQILDEYRDELTVPLLGEAVNLERSSQTAGFLLRSAVQQGHAIPHWFAIAEESGVDAEAILLEGLKAPTFRARVAVVTALAGLGERIIPTLCEMLADEYPQVRMAAIGGLEKLQPTGEWRKQLRYECYVPAGKFIMGDDKGERSERPAHRVFLKAYYIGKYQVTNAEYKLYCEDIHQPFNIPAGKETHPVVNVTWYDAVNYAAWAEMRLLTEAEWEKAASWEPTSPGKKRKYPWGDEFYQKKCNTSEGGKGSTTPVGSYSPQGDSPYGCADMAGNVWEWCSSQYKVYTYKSDDRQDLTINEWRVLRGGSFDPNLSKARCSFRAQGDPNARYHDYGFRVGSGIPSTLDSGNAET